MKAQHAGNEAHVARGGGEEVKRGGRPEPEQRASK